MHHIQRTTAVVTYYVSHSVSPSLTWGRHKRNVVIVTPFLIHVVSCMQPYHYTTPCWHASPPDIPSPCYFTSWFPSSSITLPTCMHSLRHSSSILLQDTNLPTFFLYISAPSKSPTFFSQQLLSLSFTFHSNPQFSISQVLTLRKRSWENPSSTALTCLGTLLECARDPAPHITLSWTKPTNRWVTTTNSPPYLS